MYSELDRHNSARRANDEFLRRMLGGELNGGACATVNSNVEDLPRPTLLPANNGTRCDGSENENGGEQACPKHLHAPALAMVYAPRQCWQNLLDPMSGLERGSIFAELILPLEANRGCGEKEVRTRR